MVKKHKKVKSRDKIAEIVREDEQTFWHPSTAPEMEGKPYMIFHDNIEREYAKTDQWLCDCMNFTMKIVDSNSPVPPCKHILAIKKKYNIQ